MNYREIKQSLAIHLYLSEGGNSASNHGAMPSNSSIHTTRVERHEQVRRFFQARLGVSANEYDEMAVMDDVRELLGKHGPQSKYAAHGLIKGRHKISRGEFCRIARKPEYAEMWPTRGRPKTKK